jgi:ATP-binding cassette subfamily C exporter for protease/lipase
MRPAMPNRLKQMIPKNEITEALLTFKRAFYTIGAFTACCNLLMLLPALYMMEVYDRVLSTQNENTLFALTFLLMGVFVFIHLIEYLRSMVLINIGNKIDTALNQRIYCAAFEQNLKVSGINAGQALNDLTTVRQFVTGNGVFAFFDAPWFPIYLLIIFLFNFWLGFLAAVSVALLVFLTWLNEAVSKDILREANSIAVRSSSMVTNTLRNAEVIEAMGMLANLRNRWYLIHSNFIMLQDLASSRSAKVTAVSKFVRLSVQSLILGLAALLAIRGEVTAGVMIAASILVGRAMQPVEQIIGVSKQWASTLSAYKRLDVLLLENPKRPEKMSLPRPDGRLSFESVTASPPGSSIPVIANMCFTLNCGDILGIVGPSGSGKSTIARLAVGVWKPLAGKVRLDSADVYQWNKDDLGPYVGYLPQDVELFEGTISENIARFGNVDADKVVAASRLAGVHELILRLPMGYDTKIGDSGSGLSGGQKQRIGLARALYDNPSLIVLDEPNSNLDDAGELALTNALLELQRENKTVILVSHKKNIINITNKLLIVREGINQAFGNTQEVIKFLNQKEEEGKASLSQNAKLVVPIPTSTSF